MARQKLITKAIERQFEKTGSALGKRGSKMPCIVKFFTPWGANTWWAISGERLEDGDWLFRGLATLDGSFAEWGDFRLSDLTSLTGPFGLKIERDMYYSDSEWQRDLERFGF